MPKPRTLAVVDRDLKRVRRAERKLRANYNAVHRYLAKNGGIEGLPKKGEPPSDKPTKLSVYVRHQREISKALKICLDESRALVAEKAALELQVKEAHDDYAL
jgi:hypothetical protein